MAVLIMPQYYVSASETGNRNHAAIASASDSSKDQAADETDEGDKADGADGGDSTDGGGGADGGGGTDGGGAESSEEAEYSDETISVDIPIIYDSGRSPFDFIMDPQGLICQTDAARYGGENFEEGATLYFKNIDGDYDYSSQSDWIEVINKSSVPVNVTIEAVVQNLSAMELTEECSFDDDDETASICLALVDSGGNLTFLDRSGSATIDVEIDASEDTYSFGLTGVCNPNGTWEEINEIPQVVISWTIAPLSKSKDDSDMSLQKPENSILDLEETGMNGEKTDINQEETETDMNQEETDVRQEETAAVTDNKPDDFQQEPEDLTESEVSKAETAEETKETGAAGGTEAAKETGGPEGTEAAKETGATGGTEAAKETGEARGSEAAKETGATEGPETAEKTGETEGTESATDIESARENEPVNENEVTKDTEPANGIDGSDGKGL